jgi:ketosteroid isomerase-like protein
MSKADHRIEMLQQLLGALERQALGEIEAMLTEDAVFDFPYRSGKQHIAGRAAILEDLRVGMGGFVKTMKYEMHALYPCEDPELLAAEYASEGRTHAGGVYRNTYAAFLRVQGGKISLFREFFNPQVTATAHATDGGTP